MNPIDAAIAAIDALKPGEQFSYNKIAKNLGVVRSTLIRRHKGLTQPSAIANQKLHPQQEKELVRYVQGLTKRRLPLTKEMVKSYAASIAGKGVGDKWVSGFLRRHSNKLISKWQRPMDRKRHKADSGAAIKEYFDLIHGKQQEYRLQNLSIYNMDEKGFAIGTGGRSKRIFDKQLYEKKEVTT
ncbi:hypothetical protein PtrM4_013230 [Pyrenophora tritici-repentis]|uniref:Tc5 transposase DNA-binding domain containing protein n=1 Tax=Pyrenophora tritici-repentis TaxID=45151 RepID=A0A834S7S7_9PLEO|nr:hypothetical protein PtrM4_013230 [Pyrenophora tritici-repentis]KAI1520854.1 Tc5 transposase DNA-binding domain containing protein [Pyrenophora tritici-repentis]KAI1674798.1 Tc5 transposase DNA-binding domain containing protein [Pyrenophora tritici-repentis]KAI1688076.1 Tc5 transposase DNA-binding domain containing protein [Pyrenophora tritici-repentis]